MTTAQTASFNDIGLEGLQRRVKQDLHCLNYPPKNWVPNEERKNKATTDVLIVGGGMCGMLAWFSLRIAGIQNIRIIDQNSRGKEGPWVNYARMETLRSPKQLTGPAFGFGSLTFQAWHQAQFGEQGWSDLDKIPRTMWMDYLCWYRDVLEIPIENNVTLTRVQDKENLLLLTLKGADEEALIVRKLIYATGRDGIAKPSIPAFINNLSQRFWAHSADDIDFNSLKNKRVAVIGVGASAVDNAAEALEAGAKEVRHLIRRLTMPTINKMMGIGSYGFTAGYSQLSNEWRWRFMQYSFSTQTPSPRGSTLRVSRHKNAWFHFGKSVSALIESQNDVKIEFEDGSTLTTDFLILGTGFKTDPIARKELGEAAAHIKLWEDTYTPPADEANKDLGKFPYLADDFTFQEKQLDDATWLRNVYCFNYGATASLGKVSGDIPGISDGAHWLAKSISARLYEEDIAIHWKAMQDYSKPELVGDEWIASELPE